MKPYLLSLGIGLLVGVIYSLFGVKSPAPPVIALMGLLGILAGEQLLPLGKHLLHRASEVPQQQPATPRDQPPRPSSRD
jgi:XapX domain-containing protein